MRALTLALLVVLPCAAVAKPAAPALTPDAVNGAPFAPLPEGAAKTPSAAVVRAAVLLDRARFSPGAIDGLDGDNFRRAVAAYQARAGLPGTGRLDGPTWDKLVGADPGPVLVERKITAADLKGPFVKRVPPGMEAQAKLPRLGYTSAKEELAEEVHASMGLLDALNRGASVKAGAVAVVPQVVSEKPKAEVTRIVVDKPGHAVQAYASDGTLAAYYPASIGSDEKPAPSGSFTVLRVIHNPDYTYNPAYAFKGVKAKKPFTIAPGPNNPVGSVWLDLSDKGYGIHGTPEPERVGKTQSHGCIRLTNWAAEDLASIVKVGATVEFQDQPAPVKTPSPVAVAPPSMPAATPDVTSPPAAQLPQPTAQPVPPAAQPAP